MKLNASMLRRIVQETISEARSLDEDSVFQQAKATGPLRQFVHHMNEAKKALGELFQQTSDQKASDQAQALLNAVERIVKALDHMPELTRDPWHGVRKRD